MNYKILLGLVGMGMLLAVGAYVIVSPIAKRAMLEEAGGVSVSSMPHDKSVDLPTPPSGVPTMPDAIGSIRYEEKQGESRIRYEYESDELDDERDDSPRTPSASNGTGVLPTIPAPVAPTAPFPAEYTLADISKHADATSCWSAVNGKVYDLTSFIGKHPGGERRILNMCGKDATSAFTNQHGGEPRPETMLASYYIGELVP